MSHIMTFKSPWLSLHRPLIVIVPLHLIVVYHLKQNTTLVVSPASCPLNSLIISPSPRQFLTKV